MEEYIFDNIPTKWDDITLSKWVELRNAYEDKNTDLNKDILILSILIDKDYNEVEQYPLSVIKKLNESISFIYRSIDYSATNEINIDGETYRINLKDELKFGEYVDAQTVLEAKEEDKEIKYSILLGILCRKENEQYDEKFKRTVLDKRIQIFENQPITKIYPIINFFLASFVASRMNMKEYLAKATEAVNLLLDNIENSIGFGVGKKPYMSSQEMRLQRLKEYFNSI